MKIIFTFILALVGGSYAFADPCMKSYKNCRMQSAERKYVMDRPLCKMIATCDYYCGGIYFGPKPTTLVCGMINGNYCPTAQLCLDDESVSQQDMKFMTDEPSKYRTGFIMPSTEEIKRAQDQQDSTLRGQ